VTQPSRTIFPQTTSNEDCVLNRFRKTCFLKCTQKKQWSFSAITSHYHSLFSSLGLLLLVLIRLIVKAEFPAWWMVFKSLLFESLFRSDSGKWIPLYYISQLSVKARKRLVLENLSANPFNLPTLSSGLQSYPRKRKSLSLCTN